MNAKVESYYEGIFTAVLSWIEASGKRPYVLGINGPQGSGKSTLSSDLLMRFEGVGKRAITLSVDDFYLSRQDQQDLANKYRDNPYLQQRGYPGTHDLDLGTRTVKALTEGNLPARLPRYDKSAFSGLGDRVPEGDWEVVTEFLDLIIIEGWMLGFLPTDGDLPPEMAQVNSMLSGYQSWSSFLDGFIHIIADNNSDIVSWRVEAEENMKASGKSGMSTEQVTAYIERFIPAYEVYVPGLLRQPPVAEDHLVIRIGKNRLPKEDV